MSEEHKHLIVGKPSASRSKSKADQLPIVSDAVSKEFSDSICAWIADGKTLRAYCRQDDTPSWRTVYRWIEKDQDFASRIARAREEGHDAIAEETVELIDTQPADSVEAAWRKNQVWLRLQLLSKWNPKKYGDRVGVDHQGGISVNVVTGVPGE